MLHDSALLLVGHGGVPNDMPHARVLEFKRLERDQHQSPTPAGAEALAALDHEIRHWPRTAQSDPYRAGLEALGRHLAQRLPDRRITLAYNEFCAPSVPDAIDSLVASGITSITVLTTMFTPGGAHSELEIPALLADARRKHAGVEIHYAWPFDLDELAGFLAAHADRDQPRDAKPSPGAP